MNELHIYKHMFDRTDLSEDRRFINIMKIQAQIAYVPESKERTELFEKVTTYLADNHDTYYKKTDQLNDDSWEGFDALSKK